MGEASIVRASTDRDAAVLALLPAIRALARRTSLQIAQVEYDDLVSEGCYGALLAFDAFDPERGVPFPAYAMTRAWSAMMSWARSEDFLSERIRATKRAVSARVHEAALNGGDAVSRATLLREFPNLDAVAEKVSRFDCVRLDDPCSDVNATSGDDPVRNVLDREASAEIVAVSSVLSVPERFVVDQLYRESRTVRDLGIEMRLSHQRVSQLRIAGLAKMRAALGREAA